jgi:hypothetical protein
MDEKVLRDKIAELAAKQPDLRKHLVPLLKTAEEDNSFGNGYIPMPDKLKNIKNFANGFSNPKHSVLLPERTHLLTVKVTPKVSIMAQDMLVLLRLGLLRIQSNDNGYITLYFKE